MTTLIVAIAAGALISAGFFWLLFHDLPEFVRRIEIHRQQRR